MSTLQQRTLCLFEDQTVSNFTPLVYTRPVFDLRCGALTLREKILSFYPGVPYRLWCRNELRDLVQEQNPGILVNTWEEDRVSLYINGRVLMDDALARVLTLDGANCVFAQGDTLIAARVHDSQWPLLFSESSAASVVRTAVGQIDVTARTINYTWDLIRLNRDELLEDYRRISSRYVDFSQYPRVHFFNKRDIIVGDNVDIMPGVVLDATDGPIVIGQNVRILPHTYIQGPVSIGDKSIVQAGAQLYPGTTIGPVCKVGGEVASSIIHGYSNKQHHGFLGHTYLGQWVNIGAGTTTSNLKNTYGNVSVQLGEKRIDTDMTFLGSFIGDYAKTAINTTLNAGTLIGFSSHVIGKEFPPKYIPSFCWYGPDGFSGFHLTKALEVSQRMMARRDVTMSPIASSRFVQVYGETARERDQFSHTAHMR